MGKKVIIAEKPSVAREFAKVLEIDGRNNDGYIESNDYIVTWCVGHLVTMSYPEKYDENLKFWSLKTLPFIPKEFKYEVIEAVQKQFNIVKKILTRDDVNCIYVCTDSGREGEYIYRLIDNMVGCPNKEKRRVWIDSQTEEAILEGIKQAKLLEEYNSLSDAAYLRAKEDYLIGINFSRLLSLTFGKQLARKLDEPKAVISIGRVMTCVLGMIVKREREIRNFKKVNFYKIQGTFEYEGQDIVGDFKVVEGSCVYESNKLYNETGFKKKEDATNFIKYLKSKDNQAVVKSISKKKQKENPPLLFNLAEIQNQCSKKFKISPDETLNIIQELYEKKLVTYPRTDARVLSSSVAKEITKNLNGLLKSPLDISIKKYLDKMVKERYSTNLQKTKYVDDSKITDHYAIIPTGQGFENYNKLKELQRDVYHLIVKRFLSIFYPPAEYSRLSVSLSLANEEFNNSSKVCIKQGYMEVLKDEKDVKDKEENKKNNLEIFTNLKKGDKLTLIDLKLKEGETSPPSRYSSGSIILAMENAGKLIEDENLREQIKGSGIGTSATRAEIIKKLERIEYISANKKTQILTPTKKGEEIYDIVLKTLPDMLNPELTASWEKGLTMVAQKQIKSEDFMTKLENYISVRVQKFKKAINEYYYYGF